MPIWVKMILLQLANVVVCSFFLQLMCGDEKMSLLNFIVFFKK